MQTRSITQIILLTCATLLLIILSFGLISGALDQLHRAQSFGQQAETFVQFACGLLCIVVVVTTFKWRQWARPLRISWTISLVFVAGVSSMVWGPPMPLTALAFATFALVLALIIIWALGKSPGHDI